MVATQKIIEEAFNQFNALCFEGKLPPVPMKISRARVSLGKCVYMATRPLFGKKKCSNFEIRISNQFDLTQTEIEDVVIHEMIHYYIAYFGIADTSAHGKVFRKMMQEINAKFGRNITISSRGIQQVAQTRRVNYVVAVMKFSYGKMAIKVLPRVVERICNYRIVFMSQPHVTEINFYLSDNPFFSQYPKSSVFKAHRIEAETISRELKGALKLKVGASKVEVES